MTRWLVLLTDPPQQIHDAAGRAYIDHAIASHEILGTIGTLRSSTEGEVPNLGVALPNRSAEAMPLLRRAPLGVEAVLYGLRDGTPVEQFRGVVTGITCAPESSIEITA